MCQTDIFSSPAVQFLIQLEVKFVYIFRDHSDNLFPVSPNTHKGVLVPLLPPLTPSCYSLLTTLLLLSPYVASQNSLFSRSRFILRKIRLLMNYKLVI